MRYGRYHMSKNKDQNLEDTQQLRKDEIEDALEEDTSSMYILFRILHSRDRGLLRL